MTQDTRGPCWALGTYFILDTVRKEGGRAKGRAVGAVLGEEPGKLPFLGCAGLFEEGALAVGVLLHI